MSGRGQEETARLRHNIETQLSRLLEQLEDLDEFADELDEEEAREMREDTIEALQEMKTNLAKMLAGNMTLVSELGALQLVRFFFWWIHYYFSPKRDSLISPVASTPSSFTFSPFYWPFLFSTFSSLFFSP